MFSTLLLRRMFLNIYKQNFQKERKASVNDQFTKVMSALSRYHGKITFHKSRSYSSECQKPLNLVKCLRLWLLINEAWCKKKKKILFTLVYEDFQESEYIWLSFIHSSLNASEVLWTLADSYSHYFLLHRGLTFSITIFTHLRLSYEC